MHNHPTRALPGALLLLACLPSAAMAQLEWRVSVKILHDQNGNPPPAGGANCSAINSEDKIRERIDYANAILNRLGRGYRFDLVEVFDLNPTPAPPPGFWFCLGGGKHGTCVEGSPMIPPAGDCPGGAWIRDWALLNSGCTRAKLQETVIADPEAYHYVRDAFNIYVVHDCSGGLSATRTRDDVEVSVIAIGQLIAGGFVREFHELGHSLNLCHTHGARPCEIRCGAETNDGACAAPFGDDCLDDTLPDAAGCETPDLIAQNQFGKNYVDLDCPERQQVIDVYFNIMSYHADDSRDIPCFPLPQVDCTMDVLPAVCRHVLTPDQLDKATDRTNTLFRLSLTDPSRERVATGLTHFVATSGNDTTGTGSSSEPFRTVQRAIDEARTITGDDIILLRGGDYGEGG